MNDLRLLAAGAVLAAMLLAPSCRLFRKSPQAAPPPPPAPVPAEPAPARTEKPEQATPIPTPPEISPQHPDLTQPAPPQPEGTLPPPPRKRRSTRSARTREVPPEQTSEPAPSAPAAPGEVPLPVPQVEQIFTPEQRQAYLDEIEANIGRAQRIADSAQGRALSSEQKTDLARIREFIAQAKEAREGDLFRARNLAERASILAEDLNRSLQ